MKYDFSWAFEPTVMEKEKLGIPELLDIFGSFGYINAMYHNVCNLMGSGYSVTVQGTL